MDACCPLYSRYDMRECGVSLADPVLLVCAEKAGGMRG